MPSVPPWLISLRLRCAIRRALHLPSATTHAILAAMHRSDTPTRWSLASLLLILILILPVLNVHAAGAPTDAETPISPTTISPSSLPGIGYYYTVQPTDTLWDIAVAHGISVETLIAANTQVDPKRLLAGQTTLRPRATRRRAKKADAGSAGCTRADQHAAAGGDRRARSGSGADTGAGRRTSARAGAG